MTVPISKLRGSYRFGFNGMEKEDEIYSNGGYDFGARIYDSRTGRFLSTDPMSKKYVHYTPYLFAGNTPIQAIDIKGLEKYIISCELAQNISGAYYGENIENMIRVTLVSIHGDLEVFDERNGNTYNGYFPEFEPQKFLGSSFLAGSNLYIKGDSKLIRKVNEPVYEGNASFVRGFSKEVTPTSFVFPISDAFKPVLKENHIATLEGTFRVSNGEKVFNYNIKVDDILPNTMVNIKLDYDDGGVLNNSIEIFSDGVRLKEYSNKGKDVFSVPNNSNIQIKLNGLPFDSGDNYKIKIDIEYYQQTNIDNNSNFCDE